MRRMDEGDVEFLPGQAGAQVSLAGLVGVGKQESFQLLFNASAIFYALTYLVMFALRFAGIRAVRDSALETEARGFS